MLNKSIITGALAAFACSSALIAAQAPASPSPSPAAPQQTPAATSQKTASTTLVGCVYREKDVPGRAPNVAERAGVAEDYIFAEVASSPLATAGAPESPSSTRGAGASGAAVGTSGTSGAMYKLEFVDDDKLKSLVGKRVEVVGRIDAEAGDQVAPAPGQQTTKTDKIIGRDRVNLSEFEVSTIKEVAGTCPATPGPSGR